MGINLKKVEIGCGSTKTEGYIGIDRFPLPGVDLIVDLNNQRLPFEDSSVDVIYACHSLEHLDSLEKIIFDIYRVCKHKSIVMILAPYSATSTNLANPYHKTIFNEDTFRFFSSNSTQRILPREYACPHAMNWGLEQSDNSEIKVELEILSMEYFYYQEYRHLSEIEKLHARKSLANVCDQIYYVLAVNKSKVPFTLEEMGILYKQAQKLEPSIINGLRERDRIWQYEDSIFTDITQYFENQTTVLKDDYTQSLNNIQSILKQQQENMLQYVEKQIAMLKDDYTQRLVSMQATLTTNNQQINQNLSVMEQGFLLKHDSLSALALELLKAQENNSSIHRKYSIYHKRMDLFTGIQENDISFTDGLVFSCPDFSSQSILTLSVTVPYDDYFEYQLNGYGNRIHYYLLANVGAKIFVEVIQRAKIIKQEYMTINREGHHYINVDAIKGKAAIRFKAMDNKSIIRILEINNKKLLFMGKKSIAAFVDY